PAGPARHPGRLPRPHPDRAHARAGRGGDRGLRTGAAGRPGNPDVGAQRGAHRARPARRRGPAAVGARRPDHDRDVGTGRPRATPATAATAAHRGRRGTGVHIGRLPAGARRTAGPSPYHGGPAAPHGVPEVAHRPAAAIRSRATLTIASGVNPNFAASAFSGAEAPNVCIPTTAPSAPVYRSQPSTD